MGYATRPNGTWAPCARRKARGQTLVEYALACGVLLTAALAAYEMLDLKTVIPTLLSGSMNGTVQGKTINVKPLGSL